MCGITKTPENVTKPKNVTIQARNHNNVRLGRYAHPKNWCMKGLTSGEKTDRLRAVYHRWLRPPEELVQVPTSH
jgi:hypothetical protein